MYCRNCGKEIKEGNFCPYCGTKIDVEPTPKPTAPSFDSKPIENEGNGRDGVAISELVIAIISFFVPILFVVAIILGCIGLKSRRRSLARTGIILGSIASVISILICMISIPTTLAVINRQKKQAAICEAEIIFMEAETVLAEAAAGEIHSSVKHLGSNYTVTVLSLINEGLISKSPFDGSTYDGGMTVSLNENTYQYSCSVSGTINGYHLVYDGYSFQIQ